MKNNLEILQNIEGDIGLYPTLQYRKKKLAFEINTKIPCGKSTKYLYPIYDQSPLLNNHCSCSIVCEFHMHVHNFIKKIICIQKDPWLLSKEISEISRYSRNGEDNVCSTTSHHEEWRNRIYAIVYLHLHVFPFCNTRTVLVHHLVICTETLQHEWKVIKGCLAKRMKTCIQQG